LFLLGEERHEVYEYSKPHKEARRIKVRTLYESEKWGKENEGICLKKEKVHNPCWVWIMHWWMCSEA
jgi:hypothetical protein